MKCDIPILGSLASLFVPASGTPACPDLPRMMDSLELILDQVN